MKPSKKARRDNREQQKETPLWAQTYERDAEEEQLEDMVFGGAAFKQKPLRQEDEDEDLTGLEHVPDSQLFFFDDGQGSREPSDDESESDDEAAPKGNSTPQVPKPAVVKHATSKPTVWEDPDDTELRISIATDKRLRKLRNDASEDVITGSEYEDRLRRQFESINPVPQWAATARRKRRRDEMEADDSPAGVLDSLLSSTNGIIVERPRDLLPKGTVDIERLRDANQASKTDGEVKATMFHPSPSVSVMLSAGGDRRLKLFTVDGHTNPLLQTVHIPSLPFSNAVFHPSGSHILLTGPRPFFFNYDLQSGVCTKSPRGLWGTFASKTDNADHSLEINAFSPDGRMLAVAGRRGNVYLVDWSAGSPQVISSLKMNANVRSLWWKRDGHGSLGGELLTLGDNSEVYAWDIRSRTCLNRWKDEGGYGTTSVVGSENGSLLATSSKSGLINVYNHAPSEPKPTFLKSFGNLTTAITSIGFNHTAELMVAASSKKKDQLRLIHLASLTVFSNWPTSSTPLGKVTAASFSQSSEYLAVGNSRGRVLLYGLRHFWNT